MSGVRALVVCSVTVAAFTVAFAQPPDPWTAAMDRGEAAVVRGDRAAATAAFDEACAIAGLPPDRRALCMHGKAVAAQFGGDYKAAVSGYEQALALWKQVEGGELYRCASLVNLGQVYRDLRKWQLAAGSLREARELALRHFGTRSVEYARAGAQLGILFEESGRRGDAERLLEEAIGILRAVYPQGDQEVAIALAALGHIHAHEWRFDEARALLDEAARMATDRLGEMHPVTGTIVSNQGALHRAMGDFARAEPLLKKAARAVREAWGPRSPWMATVIAEQAMLAASEGKTSVALKLMNEASGIYAELFGEDSIDLAMTRNNLGGVFVQRGKLAEAEPLLRDALRAVAKTAGGSNANTAAVHANLAELYRLGKAQAQAEEHYKTAISMYRDSGASAKRMAHALSGYSSVLPPNRRAEARELERESRRLLGRE